MALRQCIVWDNIVTKLIKCFDQSQGGWAMRHGFVDFFFLSDSFNIWCPLLIIVFIELLNQLRLKQTTNFYTQLGSSKIINKLKINKKIHQSFLLLFFWCLLSQLHITSLLLIFFLFSFFFFIMKKDMTSILNINSFIFYIFSHKFHAKNITLTSFMPKNIAVSNTLYIEINKNISHNGLRFC